MVIIRNSKGENNHTKPQWCAVQTPYPQVMVERPNKYYAGLLLEDNVGTVSEMTATCQYLYHHYELEEKYPDVADMLECIAIVEMVHLELLAETIVKLGEKPIFATRTPAGNPRWWCGDFVYYGDNICDMLAADLQAEKDAIAQYKKHIEIIEDKYIKKLISRIIEDELEHVRLFNEKINKYCK